jgi:hypothetical protein
MAWAYFFSARHPEATAIEIDWLKFVVVSDESLAKVRAKLEKNQWEVRKARVANQDDIESYPSLQDLIAWLKNEIAQYKAKKKAEALQAQRQKEEAQRREAEEEKELNRQFALARTREREENVRRQNVVQHITRGAALAHVEKISDPSVRTEVERLIEKSKLVLLHPESASLLEGVCDTIVNVRSRRSEYPQIVFVVNDLYDRLVQHREAVARSKALGASLDDIIGDANAAIRSISSRTYMYGGTIGLPLLLSAMAADSNVRKDENEIQSIERHVVGVQQATHVQQSQLRKLAETLFFLIQYYLETLSYSIGHLSKRPFLNDVAICAIFEDLPSIGAH